MTKKTSVLRASLTGFAGLVGAGIAVVVVAAVCLIPLPGFTATSTAVDVVPLPGEQTRVCAGPLLQVLPQTGDTTLYFAPGEPSVFFDSQGATLATRDLNAADVAEGGFVAAPSALSVPAAPQDAVQPLVAGVQSQQVSTEEVSGFAAAACADASSDAWLVGGATDVGRTTLILLSNPTEVTATVALDIMGGNGTVSAPGASGILVEPGQQRVLSLASFAPDLIDPIVHVTSTGGLIQASLQQTVIRALVPGGVEIIAPSAAPNTMHIVTGIALTGLAAQDSDEKGLVTSDLEPTVRVGVPGDDAADVDITVIGNSGESTEIRTTIQGHHTLQLPFSGITDGIYTVVVTGTNPIVAGVRSVQSPSSAIVVIPGMQESGETVAPAVTPTPTPTPAPTTQAPAEQGPVDGGGQGFNGGTSGTAQQVPGSQAQPTQAIPTVVGGDFAWHSSAPSLSGETLIPVAAGPNPMLSLYNPTDSPVTATLVSAANADVTIVVPAGRMMVVPLTASTRYLLTGAASLHAALTYAGVGFGASVALSPTNQLGAAIRVFPR